MDRKVQIVVTTPNGEIAETFDSSVTDLIVWKIGDRDHPATPDDIADFQKNLTEALKNPGGNAHIITHHAVDMIRLQFS